MLALLKAKDFSTEYGWVLVWIFFSELYAVLLFCIVELFLQPRRELLDICIKLTDTDFAFFGKLNCIRLLV